MESYAITPEERILVDLIRKVEWGEITIQIQDGKPVLASEFYPPQIHGYAVKKTTKINLLLDK